MSALTRSLKGGLLGASMTCVIALIVFETFEVLGHALDDPLTVRVAICGAVIGGLAGAASRFPQREFPFVWSLCIVAVFTVFTRMLTFPPAKIAFDNHPWYQRHSYEVCAAAAVLGAVTVVALACIRGESDLLMLFLDRYSNGLKGGDRVRLVKELIVLDNQGSPTGDKHSPGEVWIVLSPAIRRPSVVWMRQPDGERRTWDIDTFFDWFEVVES